jgi:pyruvate/2-oxoglutarate dehydrogenase complex dihydrolipoamide dehydrogenase (E3) component
MVVISGGIVGPEMGCVRSRLGSEVTVVEFLVISEVLTSMRKYCASHLFSKFPSIDAYLLLGKQFLDQARLPSSS